MAVLFLCLQPSLAEDIAYKEVNPNQLTVVLRRCLHVVPVFGMLHFEGHIKQADSGLDQQQDPSQTLYLPSFRQVQLLPHSWFDPDRPPGWNLQPDETVLADRKGSEIPRTSERSA